MKCLAQSAILFFMLVVSAYGAAPYNSQGQGVAEIFLANANPESGSNSPEKAKYSHGPESAEANLPLEWKNILTDLADNPVVAANPAGYYK